MKISITFVIIFIALASVSVISAKKLDPIGRRVCWDESACKTSEVCEMNVCIDACEYELEILEWNRCSKNALCITVLPHRSSCRCLPGFGGNPYSRIGCFYKIIPKRVFMIPF